MIKRFSVFVLLMCAAPALADFTFVHMSDMHVGAPGNAQVDVALVKEIEGLDPKPAFIAGTGDVSEAGAVAQYDEYRKIFATLTMPNYQAPGNHDVRWNPLGKEGFVEGVGQPLLQSWTVENVHFILLDSTTLLEHWGHFDIATLEWLKHDLQAWGTTKPVIIGFHHWIGRLPTQVDDEAELNEVVAPYNVRLWLQGHGHSDIQWSINGVPAIMVKGLYQGSYNLVQIKGDSLTVVRRYSVVSHATTELLGATPAATVGHKLILTTSLLRPAELHWDVKVDANQHITVEPGDLPKNTKLTIRVDQDKDIPMQHAGGNWIAAPDLSMAGLHRVTVQASLPDGREYQKPLSMDGDAGTTPKPIWRKNVGGEVMSHLICMGNRLFVPSMAGDCIAMDTATGQEKWRAHTDGSVFSSPLAIADSVFFGSSDHYIYSVRADTGEVLWKVQTGGAVFGGAAMAQGIVCVASCDKMVYGMDAKTGEVRWKVPIGGMTQSRVGTDGHLFFIGAWDNSFTAFDAQTGKKVWALRFGKTKSGVFSFPYSPAIGSPAVAGAKVYISSDDGLVHAIDMATGKLAWDSADHQFGYCSPLAHDGHIYQASLGDDGSVFCLDADTGAVQWNVATGSTIYDSSCVFSGGNVYVGCVNGVFSAIEARTGKMVWQYQLGPGHVLASAATDGERVFIGSMAGWVTAFPAGSAR